MLIKIYRTIILPDVLYGCETWSVTLREEHRLRVFKNRMLWNMCGPKGGNVTGEWRRRHNKELYAVYPSPNIIQVIKSSRIRWAGHVAWMQKGLGEVRTGFWWGSLREGDHVEDLGTEGRIILKWIFKKWEGGMD
jgi:hypothetical protein